VIIQHLRIVVGIFLWGLSLAVLARTVDAAQASV
jgi:hypothetical protein